MKKARITKMRCNEISAVDAGAQDAQGTVVLKRSRGEAQPATETKKRSALTDAVLGHSHLLYGIDDSMAGSTSHESTWQEGVNRDHCYTGHSHSWVRTEDGSIVVGESLGHTHTVGTLSASLVNSDASKSTRPIEISKVETMTTKIVTLTEAQAAHYATLSAADAEAFVAKSALDREADVQKAIAADVVLFKGEITGIEVRKSHGAMALKLAEQNEKNAAAAKKANEMAETEKAAREAETYKARAKSEIGHLAGSDAIKAKVLQSIDGRIVPYTTEERDEALKMLMGANEVAKSQTKAPGHDGSGAGNGGLPTGGDALGEYNASVKKFAETNGIKDLGEANEKFLGTEEGAVAKRKYDTSRGYGQR